ncbi:MAG TPA: hypothetical protein DD670_12720 [Planctomycetaceae bacterium]|nr:hypothetical protein [Planctomycetaceae bacterium]
MVDHRWETHADVPVARIGHGYDRNGNRFYRKDFVAGVAELDEFYDYDDLNRVTQLRRGAVDLELVEFQSETEKWKESWTLDALGNWGYYEQMVDNDVTQLAQSRAHSKANEVTGLTGGSWATPAHDRAGNMTTIPKPNTPTVGYTVTYDAWNRLLKLEDGETTVVIYAYDGLNQRIVKTLGNPASPDEIRHFYYNDRWQCLEERLESGSTLSGYADCRYVWGARYVDDLILRQRDTSSPKDGTLDETLYALQDANYNVVALAQPNGTIAQRFIYDAYGKVTELNANFTPYSGSGLAWEYLCVLSASVYESSAGICYRWLPGEISWRMIDEQDQGRRVGEAGEGSASVRPVASHASSPIAAARIAVGRGGRVGA